MRFLLMIVCLLYTVTTVAQTGKSQSDQDSTQYTVTGFKTWFGNDLSDTVNNYGMHFYDVRCGRYILVSNNDAKDNPYEFKSKRQKAVRKKEKVKKVGCRLTV
jgi:hypothetical protein